MKFLWEATDIVAGITVQNPKTTEKFVIGRFNLEDGRGDVFSLVSLVGADILSPQGKSRDELANTLNLFGAIPIKSA